MLLALTCALCAAQPIQAPPTSAGSTELRLALSEDVPAHPGASVVTDLRPSAPEQHHDQVPPAREPLRPQLQGSGDGDHSDHSDHMTTMWIVMGGMMVVMMVGAGVYYMNHKSTAGTPIHSSSLTGPAAFAVPVAGPGGG